MVIVPLALYPDDLFSVMEALLDDVGVLENWYKYTPPFNLRVILDEDKLFEAYEVLLGFIE